MVRWSALAGALLLFALSSCTRTDEAAPDGVAAGRVLEPLPQPPALEVAREPLLGVAGELHVVAARPRGEAAGEFHPTVTFSKPVVALQGIEGEEPLPPPARIEPAVEGEWRWLGSAAVEFVPARQLPMATEFEVIVPAGLTALDGSTLAAEYRFSFATPPPEVQSIEPRPGHRWLEPEQTFEVVLNQPVRDLGAHVRIEGAGGPAIPLRVVEERSVVDEVREGERRRYPPDPADRFRNQQVRYRLVPIRPLPADAPLQLVFDGSLRGTQGPRTLGRELRYDYRSRGPMRLLAAQKCFWTDSPCPWGPVVITATNPIDLGRLRERLTVEPPVEIAWDDAHVGEPNEWSALQEPWAMLPGGWRPGTAYRIRVAAGPLDTLGQEAPAFETTVRLDDRIPDFEVGSTVALLESAGDGALPVETINLPRLDVSLWELDPARMVQALRKHEPPKTPPQLRFSLETAGTPNVGRWHPLDVRQVLGGKRSGLFFASIRAPGLPHRGPSHVVGQITDLAVHAKLGATSGVVWVTRLSTGASVPDASLALYDRDGVRRWTGRTDGEGIAHLPGLAELIPAEDRGYLWSAPFALVTASDGEEIGATLSTWMGGLSPADFDLPMDWEGGERKSLGLVFADRGIYRPGDTVHTKGVGRFRRLGSLQKPPSGTPVQLVLRDSRGNEAGRKEVAIGPYGTFHADFAIPADAPLGFWQLEATATVGGETLHWGGSLRVEEYRAPQFQVDVKLRRDEAVAGDPLAADVHARYLFGGALADGAVRWSVSRTSTEFAPPGNPGFAFGSRTWWWDDGPPVGSTAIAGGGTGTTDEQGHLAIDLGKAEAPAGKTWVYTVEAEVADVNRQRVANRASLTVHPAALYAGARVATTGFAEVGRPVAVELVAVRPDGGRVEEAPIELAIRRREWKSIRKQGVGGHWYTESEPVEIEASRCSVRSARAPERCTFTPEAPGLYLIDATVTDEAGRKQTTRDSFYVVGSGWVSWQRSDSDRIDLVPDKAVYEPGDTARILVKSPWPEAEALLTVEREGVVSARRVRLAGAASTLEVPVTEAEIPNVFVGVLLFRGRVEEGGIESGEDPGRPAIRVGYTELKVERAARRLSVEVRPDAAEKQPRQRVRVDLEVRDAAGKGAQAELAVWAVDEAVLRLTDYRLPDLLEALHPRQGLSVRIGEPLLHLVQRRLYGEKGRSPGGGGGADGSGAGFRSRFQTTVLFAPAVVTDPSGRARVEFELPDNLTTYRILAVAIDGADRVGGGEAAVRVSKPLLALPALPRLARVGDRLEAGVVLHGHRFSAPEVRVRAEAEGLRLEGPAEQTVAVVEGRPVEVRFRFVAERPGTAILRFSAEGGGARDGVEQRLPVRLPVSVETVATWGETKGSVREGIELPQGARADVGGLEVQLASTALAGLDENFDQLVEYPWGCLEQEASRLVPFVALREIAGSFGIPWKAAAERWIGADALASRGSRDPDEVARSTVRAIERLQSHDGGYRYWPSSPCNSQLGSAWAVLALHRAKEVGYPVDAEALAKGQRYLAEKVAAGRCESCGWGCAPPDDAVRVFALWSLARTGSPRPSYYGELYRRREALPLFARALLADSLWVGGGDRSWARQILQEVLDLAKESPSEVHFEELHPRTYAALWSSDVRTTAIVLGTLATISPDHPWIGKMARWLESARGRDGRWDSTQEAAFSLMALVEVLRGKEAERPDFTATVTLAGEAIASHRFEGRSMEVARAEVPLSGLRPGPLDFAKEGSGLLYYGARLRYAPQDLPTAPLERGLAVQRWFEPWEGGGQARRFYAGELVRVRVRVATSQERHYAVIEVPLPAGLEPVDVTLASAAALPVDAADEGPGPGYEYESAEDLYDGRGETEEFQPWALRFYSPFDHTEMRDDRVVFFADRLPPGVHVASVVARATTPGRFVLPPARAEEMYAPEVFGRSDGGELEVVLGRPLAER